MTVGVRLEFAEALRDALPGGPEVIDHARNLDALESPVVMLERQSVAKPSNAMAGYLATFVVHVVSPRIDRYTADDALDDALDVVVLALDAIPFCNWTTATRSVFLDSYPSFQVEVQTITTKSEGV